MIVGLRMKMETSKSIFILLIELDLSKAVNHSTRACFMKYQTTYLEICSSHVSGVFLLDTVLTYFSHSAIAALALAVSYIIFVEHEEATDSQTSISSSSDIEGKFSTSSLGRNNVLTGRTLDASGCADHGLAYE
jgi:hypothetical protein